MRVVVVAPLKLGETLRRLESGACGFLDDDQRVRYKPATVARRGERLLGEALCVGRIEEGERERLDRMHRPQFRRIAPEDARDRRKAERLDILPLQRACFGAVVDELRERGWVEGQNLIFDRRGGDGNSERVPALAAELVQMKVDVIVSFGAVAEL